MDCCPREKCELHLGKKLPSISLDLGKSRSMAEKWRLIIRQPDTFATSSRNVGSAAIPDQCVVSMTKGAAHSNGCWNCSASRMFAQPARILSQMQSVKECIKQQAMCYKP
eukprot:CCRYP_016446-RA/>CCRYP_016446-RA protein AED:0.45 eAED:1.00 QI:0/0/0/1/0/0/3/0/109